MAVRVNLRNLSPEARKQIRTALHVSSRKTSRAKLSPALITEATASKWRNVRTTVDGFNFASQREANRYAELKIELLAGEITDLALQKPFSLDVNGVHICDYIADFVYTRKGSEIVEDAKGKATDLFLIKKALMYAIHRIHVVEV